MHFTKQRQFSIYLILPLVSLFLLVTAIYVSFQSFVQQTENDNFHICNSLPQKSKHSTKYDVVFFAATVSMLPPLKLAIRSLRSTGTQSRIILFTDINFNPSMYDAEFLKENNVELERKLIPSYENKTMVPHMERFVCEYEWLKEHLNKTRIRKILHSDAYDVFFQKDPFEEAIIPSDQLVFVIEPHPIRSCGWNLNWFLKCFGERELQTYKNEFILCSGTIAGNATEYFSLLKIMINLPEWEKCYGESMDQPILNRLVWSGRLKSKKVNYRFTGCNGGFLTVQWCVINQSVNINDKGQILSPSGQPPAYIHQYNRIDKLEKYLYKSCQMRRPKKK